MPRRFDEAERRRLVSQAALRRFIEKEFDDLEALVFWAKDAFDQSSKSELIRNRFTELYDAYQLRMNNFASNPSFLNGFISDPRISFVQKNAIAESFIQPLRNLVDQIVGIAELHLIPPYLAVLDVPK